MAEASSARFAEVSERMHSECVRVLSNIVICLDLMPMDQWSSQQCRFVASPQRQGFSASERVRGWWDTPSARRNARRSQSKRMPVARTIAGLMNNGRDALSKSATATIAAIEQGIPLAVEAREIIAAFHTMIRKKAHVDLDPWLGNEPRKSRRVFANGVARDEVAINAANTTSRFNEQTEGQITKINLVQRRAKLELPKARLIGAPCPRCTKCVRAKFANDDAIAVSARDTKALLSSSRRSFGAAS